MAETLVPRAPRPAGWTVLARDVHVGRYELDLAAVDPGPPPALVVVEVRWLRRREYGLAEETVDHRKRARVRRRRTLCSTADPCLAARRLAAPAPAARSRRRRAWRAGRGAAVYPAPPGGLLEHHRRCVTPRTSLPRVVTMHDGPWPRSDAANRLEELPTR